MSMKTDVQISSKGVIKFIIGSLVAIFLFLTPIPMEETFNIPLGIAIGWLEDTFILQQFLGFETISIGVLIAFITTSIAVIGTVLAYANVKFICNNEKLKGIFKAHPVFAISRVLGLLFLSMVLFDFGPGFIIDPNVGGIMVHVLVNGLVFIFIILALAIPILTDFGLMEFIGILIKKFVNALFLLPGRASVDLAGSWFGSSSVSVMITTDQHEKGFYTGREAAAICVNFAFVSLPFSLVVANQLGLDGNFPLWYLTISTVCVILGIVMPRIWPLNKLADTYVEGVGKQIDEEVEVGGSRFKKAVALASTRAEKTTARGVIKSGLNFYVSVFMDLIPVITAWGIMALAIGEHTALFTWISAPMGWFLSIFNIPGAMAYAGAALIGFIDMYLPALMIGSDTYFQTRFILGALSIVQIIYMAETGILIARSKIPLGVGKLFLIFLIRTLLGLPLIVLFTWILNTLGWIG